MKFNSIFVEIKQGDRQVYKLRDQSLQFELKSLNTEIVNKFNLTIPNRNAIIKSLIQFLSQGSVYCNQSDLGATPQEFYIIKSDIKNFFPSINKHRLYKKLVKSSLLNDSSMDIIKTFIFNSDILGVPLGMPFSNALSEVYLEEFDDAIRREFSPIFYIRYVDDILIIKNYPSGDNIDESREKRLLSTELNNFGLSVNNDKTRIYKCKNNAIEFEYLGYNFKIENKKLYIDIAQKKYEKKVLNKLTRYFKYYNSSSCTDEDFWILYYRLKNLIYGVTSSGEKGVDHKLKFGIGFSYKFINSGNSLTALLKTFHYFRKRYSDKFTSEQTAHLFSLITVNSSSNGRIILNQFSDIDDILLLLKKRMNYTKCSISKLEHIANQIGCSTTVRSSDGLYQRNLQIIIMKKLRIN
ncbi:RNA-directed DNA polymerase [Streptococcus suis]|uniref:RNA-directed DNA polymerase n=1 Tax=Streptococcus suis TaxID=1307 RepID=UPI0019601935|nr:RNA-directed DNA polymerase [Streptococcus suis]MBM7284414.1 RNA-directed DNA polymerase [Streptococcus suis]MBO3643265.1 RNA-directed DNA polymerase [Streptococcus suis]MCO8237117.1 RNA-directed DNA polymerase [Streptococcus suis]HEM3532990.1 RNA-directed DNA polymerase [Streptococcus suis]